MAKDLKDASADKRDEISKKQISAQVLAETLKRAGEATLAKKMDGYMVKIYKVVVADAERYAKAHDLEVVMQYNEPLDDKELFSSPNVARKMNAGAAVPLYAAPGVDISKELLVLLQEDMKKEE